jgi:hypothetical protein
VLQLLISLCKRLCIWHKTLSHNHIFKETILFFKNIILLNMSICIYIYIYYYYYDRLIVGVITGIEFCYCLSYLPLAFVSLSFGFFFGLYLIFNLYLEILSKHVNKKYMSWIINILSTNITTAIINISIIIIFGCKSLAYWRSEEEISFHNLFTFIFWKSLPTADYLYKIYKILIPEAGHYKHSTSLLNTEHFFDRNFFL